MKTVSPSYALLPRHIIERIIEYTLNAPKKDTRAGRIIDTQIAHICRGWRMVFMRHACEKLSFVFSENRSVSSYLSRWPEYLSPPDFEYYHLVKDIEITVNGWSCITDGDTLFTFQNYPYANAVFPKARLLSIAVIDHEFNFDSETIGTDAQDNIAKSMQCIRSKAPSCCNINLHWYSENFTRSHKVSGSFINGVSASIIEGAYNVSIQTWPYDDIPADSIPESAKDITHLTFDFCGRHELAQELLRRSSGSLIDLVAIHLDRDAVSKLLNYGSGQPIIYRCLKRVRLVDYDKAASKRRRELLLQSNDFDLQTSNAVHFPVLDSIKLLSPYAFHDDSLFRGTGGCLERLYVHVDSNFMDMAKQHQIFSTNAFIRLRYLNIDMMAYYDYSTESQNACHKFAEKLFKQIPTSFPNLQELCFRHVLKEASVVRLIKETLVNSLLRVLDLTGLAPEFDQIIDIIHSIPTLQKLRCHLAISEPEIAGVEKAKIPQYLQTVNYPLSSRFRVLELVWNHNVVTVYAATIAALLAIACPSFNRLVPRGVSGDNLEKEIVKVLKKSAYTPYASHVRAILFN